MRPRDRRPSPFLRRRRVVETDTDANPYVVTIASAVVAPCVVE
jgi:hypothetical protein